MALILNYDFHLIFFFRKGNNMQTKVDDDDDDDDRYDYVDSMNFLFFFV